MRAGVIAGWFVLASIVGSHALAQPAGETSAEQLDAARALAEAGLQLYEDGDYATSIARFRSAENIVHAPPHLLYLARGLEKTGKLVEARDVYRRLLDEEVSPDAPDAFREAQVDGKKELEALGSRIPSVRLSLPADAPEEATVWLDGALVAREALQSPIDVDPGSHTFELRLEGHVPSSRSVDVGADDRELAVELELGPVGQAPDGPPDTAGQGEDDGPSLAGPLVLLGLGVAGLGVGIVTGVLTLNDAAELKDSCPSNPCDPDNESLADSVHTLGNVSTVAFIAGGTVAAAGLLWLALQGGDEPAPVDEPSEGADEADVATLSVAPIVGPAFFGLTGTF